MKRDFVGIFVKIGLIVIVIGLTLCAVVGVAILLMYMLSCARGML